MSPAQRRADAVKGPRVPTVNPEPPEAISLPFWPLEMETEGLQVKGQNPEPLPGLLRHWGRECLEEMSHDCVSF